MLYYSPEYVKELFLAIISYRKDERPTYETDNVLIRCYKWGDANKVLALMEEVYIRELGWNLLFIRDCASVFAEMLKTFDHKRELFLVAEVDNRLVGVMFMKYQGDRTAFIRWLTLIKDFRGNGIGRELLFKAIRFSKKRRYKKVRLVTVGMLDRARRFYMEAGFQEVERRDEYQWEMNITLCSMELRI